MMRPEAGIAGTVEKNFKSDILDGHGTDIMICPYSLLDHSIRMSCYRLSSEKQGIQVSLPRPKTQCVLLQHPTPHTIAILKSSAPAVLHLCPQYRSLPSRILDTGTRPPFLASFRRSCVR